MAPARILSLDDNALPSELGKLIIDAQNKALAHKDHFDIGISGGSQAPTLAKSLLGNAEVKWKSWRVWLVDERIVPLDHEDSNWGLFQSHILDKLPEGERPEGHMLSRALLEKGDSASSAEFAADYQQQLISALGNEPKLDLALLGMGPDGHTCSLFPGHGLLDEKYLLIASLDDSPKPPPRRITFTEPSLALVEQIVFLATGGSKKEAVHKIFTENDTSLPSKRVIDIAKHQVVFLTDPAALGE